MGQSARWLDMLLTVVKVAVTHPSRQLLESCLS